MCAVASEKEREYSTMGSEDVIKMAAGRQDGGRERKLVLLVLSTAQFTHNGTTKKGEKKGIESKIMSNN